MVKSQSGLQDWWMQRISASFLSIFVLPLLVLWLGGWFTSPADWYMFLSSDFGKVLTAIGLIGFGLHIRIGLWVVVTDYVPRRVQKLVTVLCNIWILALVGYSAYLIWIL